MTPLIPVDPYEVLGVSRDCDTPTLRIAHRKLLLRHHPDRIHDPDLKLRARDDFQRIQQAYEILIDPDRRARYDDEAMVPVRRKEDKPGLYSGDTTWGKSRRRAGSVHSRRSSRNSSLGGGRRFETDYQRPTFARGRAGSGSDYDIRGTNSRGLPPEPKSRRKATPTERSDATTTSSESGEEIWPAGELWLPEWDVWMSRIHKCDRIDPSTGKTCTSKFTLADSLLRHKVMSHHAYENIFRFQLCPKIYSRNGHFRHHMRKVHDDFEPYENPPELQCTGCPPCTRSFTRAVDLEVHRYFHIGEDFGAWPCHCGVLFYDCAPSLYHEVGIHADTEVSADAVLERNRQALNLPDAKWQEHLAETRELIANLLAMVLREFPYHPAFFADSKVISAPETNIPSRSHVAQDTPPEPDDAVRDTTGEPEQGTRTPYEDVERVCYICHQSIQIRKRRDWQKHVFKDLQPYQCLEKQCTDADGSFSSVKDLRLHYTNKHSDSRLLGKKQSAPPCVFCQEDIHHMLPPARFRHLGRHMEEIAFAVVPRPFEDWDFYSASSERTDIHPDKKKARKFSRIPMPTKRTIYKSEPSL